MRSTREKINYLNSRTHHLVFDYTLDGESCCEVMVPLTSEVVETLKSLGVDDSWIELNKQKQLGEGYMIDLTYVGFDKCGAVWWDRTHGFMEYMLDDVTENEKFRIITLCGSTRFKKEFEEITAKLTLAGNVVISVGVFAHADGVEITEEQKERLDSIHLQKIDMSDEIIVIDVYGYVGESTKREIDYAKSLGKPVIYYTDIVKKDILHLSNIE